MGLASDSDQGSAGAVPSATAEAFGARVSMPIEGRSLFFVIGHAGSPETSVRAAGGFVVTHFPDRRRVLAVAPLAAHPALRHDPAVQLAGPVSIDPDRFGRFVELIGLDGRRTP